MSQDGQDALGPSAGLSPLARARLDDLLEELLQRVEGVLDTQDRLRGLLDAVVAIAGDLSLDRVLQRIVDVAAQLADARYAAVGVLGTGKERRLVEFVTHGLTDEQRARIGPLPRGHGLLGLIIDTPEPLRLSSIGDHPNSYGFPANHPAMGSFLGVPVRIRDKVFGNLYLTEKAGGGDFTEEDEEIVVALAAAAGVVIENARLYEETGRRQRWLEAAADVTAAVLGPGHGADRLQQVADRSRVVAAAAVAALLRPGEPSDNELVVVAVSGGAPDGLLGATVTGDVARLADVRVVDPGTGWGGPSLEQELSDGPLMLVPLHTAAGSEGLLLLGWARSRDEAFYATDLLLPAVFGEQVALALRVARAQEDEARLAVFVDRDRIGRDLHDLVIQRLFAIGLTLESASRLATRPEVASRIAASVDDLDATIKDIRRTIFELSAPEESSDLRSELAESIALVVPALGFQPSLRTTGPVDSAVPAAVRPHLLAVLREALSNVARHAAASSVEVTVAVDDQVTLEVRDDGRGLPEGGRRSGLRNLAERAEELGGSFSMGPAEDGPGTLLCWRVPAR